MVGDGNYTSDIDLAYKMLERSGQTIKDGMANLDKIYSQTSGQQKDILDKCKSDYDQALKDLDQAFKYFHSSITDKDWAYWSMNQLNVTMNVYFCTDEMVAAKATDHPFWQAANDMSKFMFNAYDLSSKTIGYGPGFDGMEPKVGDH